MLNIDFTKIYKESKKFDRILTFSYEEFRNFDAFMGSLSRYTILGNRYTAILRVSYSSLSTGEYTQYKMLGSQIPLTAYTEDELFLSIKDVYNIIVQRFKSSMDNYNYNEFDLINVQILLFSLGAKKFIQNNKPTSRTFGSQKDLVNMSKLNDSYNFSNAIYTESNIESEVDVTIDIDKEIDKNKDKGYTQKVLLSNEKKTNIISLLAKYKHSDICKENTKYYNINRRGSNYIIVVNEICNRKYIDIFTLNGKFVNNIVYEFISNKVYTRKTGNVTLYINDKGIYKKDINLKLSGVYSYKKTGSANSMINPDWKIGTIDLETYKEGDISKTYAIGFYTSGLIKNKLIRNFLTI